MTVQLVPLPLTPVILALTTPGGGTRLKLPAVRPVTGSPKTTDQVTIGLLVGLAPLRVIDVTVVDGGWLIVRLAVTVAPSTVAAALPAPGDAPAV